MTQGTISDSNEAAAISGHIESRNGATSQAIFVDREHVFCLDALRFIAALWVVFSHLGPIPVFAGIDRQQPIGFFLHGIWGILYSGPAAVIIFFVISGFCIHFPYARGAVFRPVPYFIRRYVRIGIPMVVAITLTEFVGIDSLSFVDAILWSLVAELMYYTLYPAIRQLANQFGINAVVMAAFALSLAVILSDPAAKGYGVYGWKLNWLLGLPCWLLGVRLAEVWGRREFTGASGASNVNIWKWRILIWASSAVCLALNFHSAIGYPWTLNVFAIVAYIWIALEIRRANGSERPWRVLERAGRWSYSLYLCHMFAARMYSEYEFLPDLGPVGDWIFRIMFVLITSYLFYLFVERPAHSLARHVGRLSGLNLTGA